MHQANCKDPDEGTELADSDALRRDLGLPPSVGIPVSILGYWGVKLVEHVAVWPERLTVTSTWTVYPTVAPEMSKAMLA